MSSTLESNTECTKNVNKVFSKNLVLVFEVPFIRVANKVVCEPVELGLFVKQTNDELV